MKKLTALFLALMFASLTLACASADTDMQPYLLGEFQIEIPLGWTSEEEFNNSVVYFFPDNDQSGAETFIFAATFPPANSDVTPEEHIQSLVNNAFGNGKNVDIEFGVQNGCLMGKFISTSNDGSTNNYGAAYNGLSSVMIILHQNTLVSDSAKKAEFENFISGIRFAENEYFNFSTEELYGMTLDDLIALRQQITYAMWNTEEWQEVIVPIGVYEFGVDIPAEHWNISVPDGEYTVVSWVTKLDESGKDYDYKDELYSTGIMSKTYKSYDHFDGDYPEVIDIDAKEGTFLIVEMGNVVFTPYAGKPALGFK